MNIVADLHTHTVASGHAADTIRTICELASKRGLEGVAITDHGPGVPGGANSINFMNLKRMTGSIETPIRVIAGIEEDISNVKGDLTLDEETLGGLEIVTAGCHPFTWMAEQPMKVRTDAIINAVERNKIDILTHPAGSKYGLDLAAVTTVCAQNGVALELNESKTEDRGAILQFLEMCAKSGAPIVISSDAHVAEEVGIFSRSFSILQTMHFPNNLVVNRAVDAIVAFFDIEWDVR